MEIVTLKELNIRLKALQHKIDNASATLPTLGNIAQNTIEESFDNQASPFKEKWIPNKPSTLRFKKGNKTLIDSGALCVSFTQRITGKSVQIGTNKQYARIHNFGGKAGRNKKVNIPERPFIPVKQNGEVAKDFAQKIENFLKKYILS